MPHQHGDLTQGGGTTPVATQSRTTVAVQRIENGLVAVAIVTVVVISGLPWWVLLAAFLLFDLSALGYLRSARAGALGYNLVHNYVAPAVLTISYAILSANGVRLDWLLLLAASWGFHVAVDRALGYGLKLASFRQTHLGRIGRAAEIA